MRWRFALAAGLLAAGGAVAAPARPYAIPSYDAAGLAAACDAAIIHARRSIAAMEAKPGAGSILAEWNRYQMEVDAIANVVDLLGGVHPDALVRAAAEPCQQKLASLSTRLFQDEKLFARVQALRPANPRDAKYRKDLIRSFEDTGVALPPDKRERATLILDRIETLRQEFERNAREDATKIAFTPAEMEGLPEAYLAARKRDAAGNYVLGFDQPSYGPFMANARSEAARERYLRMRFTQGGTRNLEVLGELFTLRRELAGLYGLPSYAAYGLRRKMAGSPEAVMKFLGEVKAAVTEGEARELEELRAEKAKQTDVPLGEARVRPWDVQYFQEVIRRERFAVDQEKLRPYFPADKSVDFALLVARKLYGVDFREVKAPSWHPDVRYFEMLDGATGRYRASFYVDLFPREGKRAGAAAYPLRNRSRLAGQLPSAALVANFDRAGFNQRELQTLMHEFGHVLHMLLSDADYAAHGGANVKWDFVEAPSQMFEEWARREQPLALFRQVCPECPQLSREEIQRLDAARRYGQGIGYSRQWLLAAFDMELSTQPRPVMEVWKRLEAATPGGYVEGTMFPAAFRHIAGGYAAGYYGYMWSQVIALDMLSPFKADMLDAKVGARYRDTLLAPGGQEDENDMVRKFLGRAPSSEAFFAEITGKR